MLNGIGEDILQSLSCLCLDCLIGVGPFHCIPLSLEELKRQKRFLGKQYQFFLLFAVFAYQFQHFRPHAFE